MICVFVRVSVCGCVCVSVCVGVNRSSSTIICVCARLGDMGWLRWVGCLKIQVSLQNTGLFYRALLQKRPIFLSILLIVATPY